MRIPVASDTGVLSPYFVNAAGDAFATTGTPTCAVVNAAGTTLTAPTVSTVSAGLYSAALTAATHCTQPDRLTLTWAGTVATLARSMTQVVEVSHPYRSVPEIRALDGIGTNYTAAKIRSVIEAFEDIAEGYTGQAYVRRCKVLQVPYTSGSLDLGVMGPVTLRTITVDGNSHSLTDVDVDNYGVLRFDYTPITTDEGVTVVLEHGLQAPPQAVLDACDIYCSAMLKRSTAGVQRDAFMTVQEGVSFRFSTPNKAEGRPTGFIDADLLLNSVPNHKTVRIA